MKQLLVVISSHQAVTSSYGAIMRQLPVVISSYQAVTGGYWPVMRQLLLVISYWWLWGNYEAVTSSY